MNFIKTKLKYTFLILFVFSPYFSNASTTSGVIDPSDLGYNKAYLVNDGGLGVESKEIIVGKFTTQSEQNATVSDNGLLGWMWGSATGWISFNCQNTNSCNLSQYGVSIDSSGNLSGYAWGPQSGWVNFNPEGAGSNSVKISSQGDFTGYAWSQSFGYISFNCSNDNSCGTLNFKTSTDYIPRNSRVSEPAGVVALFSGNNIQYIPPINGFNVPIIRAGVGYVKESSETFLKSSKNKINSFKTGFNKVITRKEKVLPTQDEDTPMVKNNPTSSSTESSNYSTSKKWIKQIINKLFRKLIEIF